MDRIYRLGMIGAGIIAEPHLKAASAMDNIRLSAIADIVKEKAEALAAGYSMTAYADYREMLDKEQLDIVIINLPHYLHKKAAMDCADKGINVLLEKPMALDEQECDEIISACERQRVKLAVGHIQHYRPENMKAREIVESGKFGKLLMITNVRYADYFTEKRPQWFLHNATAGGGIIMNLGAHSFDIIQFLAGSKVKSVYAATGKYATGVEVEGNGQIFASLENGVTASITISGYKTVPGQETVLIFTGGMVKWTSGIEGTRLFVSKEGVYEEVRLEQNNAMGQQLADFVRCIEEDGVPPITGDYGRSIIRAVKAVYASSATSSEIII